MEPNTLNINTENVFVAGMGLAWEMTKYSLMKSRQEFNADKMREEFELNYNAVTKAVGQSQTARVTSR